MSLGHRLAWLAIVLLTALGAAEPPASPAAEPVFEFDVADVLPSAALEPPPDDAPWRRVGLPDDWHRTRPGFAGSMWYRVSFESIPGPHAVHTLYAPRVGAREIAFFLNGSLLVQARPAGDAWALNWEPPLRSAVAPGALRPGRNVLHVRVAGTADLHQGLTRFSLGPSAVVLPRAFRRYELQIAWQRMAGGAALLVGMLALAFWRRRRDDRVMFWFAAAALAWAVTALPWFLLPFGPWRDAALLFSLALRFAYAPPLMLLCLAAAGRRWRAAEAAIVAFALVGVVLPGLVDSQWRGVIVTAWSAICLAALLSLTALVVHARLRRRPDASWLLVVVTTLVAGFDFADLGRWLGWLDFDNLTFGSLHAPAVLLAIGWAIVERHSRAKAAASDATAALEARVAAKTREIEATYRRLRDAERQSALAQERQRIMVEMHDGVGAILLRLEAASQAGAAAPVLERLAQEALLELRIAVDSLQPVDGDIGVLLGNVRHRLREVIEQAGVRFRWQVDELPPLESLTPKAVLALQRIMLQAISGALERAPGGRVAVAAAPDRAGERLLVEVSDDGVTPAVADCSGERLQGLALGLGGKLDVTPLRPGTRVTLSLPLPRSEAGSQLAAAASAA